jgi:hypothetical protein
MSKRAVQLLEAADGQISELIDLLSEGGEAALSRACQGREKMGDGTVAACAFHTAERYQLIAGFLRDASRTSGARAAGAQRRHRIPRFLLARGHKPPSHADGGHGHDAQDDRYTAENIELEHLLEQLAASRDAFGFLADVTDEQLDSVPPAGSFRFCDGQRTLEQVLAGLLKHQSHQIDAVRATVA